MCNLVSVFSTVMFNVTEQEGYYFVLLQYHTNQSDARSITFTNGQFH